jgi:ABC-type lipoprotein release transport system permease subunit
VLALRLAWRNVWRNLRRTVIVVVAVAVGVAGCLFSMALNYGMVVQMVETAISTELGHVQIHARGFDRDPALQVRLVDGGRAGARALAEVEGVEAWTPRVIGQGLVSSPRANVGVRVLGIDPAREARVSRLADSITRGRYLDGSRRRVLLGEDLARRLHVDVGDKVVISVQDLEGELTGEAVRVAGLFRTPSSELDRGTLYLRIDEGQTLLGLGDAISEIVVVAESRGDVSAVRDALAARLPDAEVRSWEELRPILVYLIRSFDQIGAFVYGAIFVAMAFGIANVLLMAVYERMREIGILVSVGMGRGRLLAMIVLESLLVTLMGVGLGLGAAALAVASLPEGIDLSRWAEGLEAFGVGTRIVPVLRRGDFSVPVAVALVTALVASAWPAWRAARLRPAEAMRHT